VGIHGLIGDEAPSRCEESWGETVATGGRKFKEVKEEEEGLCKESHRYNKYHLIGTCTMDGVVGDRWKVKGVKALRVINTSVFVEDVSGNITSSTYAAAEGGRQSPNAKLQLAVLLDVLMFCLAA